MRKNFATLLLISTSLSYAGAFSTDVKISSKLEIVKGNNLEINSADKIILKPTILDIEFDYKPTWGSGTLKINQGKTSLKIKVPKDRYHNEGEFTLYSVDSDLNYDIYVRRSEKKLVSSAEKTELVNCSFNKPTGVDQFGNITYKSLAGTQEALVRHDKFNRTYKISFVMNNKMEAFSSQVTESDSETKLKDITNCLPTDFRGMINN